MEPLTGTFHDAQTGETIVRELTTEEIEALEASDALAG
jgi:hypothetical protein